MFKGILGLLFFVSLSAFALIGGNQEDLPQVVFVKGDAFIYDANAKERKATKGMRLKEGEVIRTAEKSLLVIHIRDRVKIKVNPRTVVEVESLLAEKTIISKPKDDSLFIHVGNIFVRFIKGDVSGYMTVKSKFTALGVRGTKFFVHVEPSDDRQYSMAVESGEVQVKGQLTDSQVNVKAGQGTLMDPHGKMVTAQKYAWSKELNWNLDPSQGNLFTSEKVFAQIRQNWENYSKKIIQKRDSFFKSQRDKFNNLIKE